MTQASPAAGTHTREGGKRLRSGVLLLRWADTRNKLDKEDVVPTSKQVTDSGTQPVTQSMNMTAIVIELNSSLYPDRKSAMSDTKNNYTNLKSLVFTN